MLRLRIRPVTIRHIGGRGATHPAFLSGAHRGIAWEVLRELLRLTLQPAGRKLYQSQTLMLKQSRTIPGRRVSRRVFLGVFLAAGLAIAFFVGFLLAAFSY